MGHAASLLDLSRQRAKRGLHTAQEVLSPPHRPAPDSALAPPPPASSPAPGPAAELPSHPASAGPAAPSSPEQPCSTLPRTALLLFSGVPELGNQPALRDALTRLHFTVDCRDKLLGSDVRHRLDARETQLEILGAVGRLEFGFIFCGIPCGPVTILRDDPSAPQLFDRDGPIEPCPAGWETYRAAYLDLVDFMCEVFELADSLGVLVIAENPADVSTRGTPWYWAAKAHHGSLLRHARVRRMRERCMLLVVVTAQCGWGANYRKWTLFLYSAAALPFMGGWQNIICKHGRFGHSLVAYGLDQHGHSLSAQAAAYPGALNQGIANVADLFLTSTEARNASRCSQCPPLDPVVLAAVDAARASRPRFASLRNLMPASDTELRAAAIPVLAPPSPPIPRRTAELANPWPPGAEAHRPIAIEQLFKPGVYAGLDTWLEEQEDELLQAAADAHMPDTLLGWQRTCRARLERKRARSESHSPGPPRHGKRPRMYTIPADDHTYPGTTFDCTDRDDCIPVTVSHRGTLFPGSHKQLNAERLLDLAAGVGFSDPDLADQLPGGLESRSTVPRDTVVFCHHPAFFEHFGKAAAVIASDLSEQWVRPPPPRAREQRAHLPFVPCHSDPRDVIMREVSKVQRNPDGSSSVVEVQKARVSTNLSAGGARAVNAGVLDHDRSTTLPTTQQLGRSAAIAATAYTDPTPRRLPSAQAAVAQPCAGPRPKPAAVVTAAPATAGQTADPFGRLARKRPRDDGEPPHPDSRTVATAVPAARASHPVRVDPPPPTADGYFPVSVVWPSPMANPFPIGPGVSRDTVCDAAELYLADPASANVPAIALSFGIPRTRGGPSWAHACGAACDAALQDLARQVAFEGAKLRLCCVCGRGERCHRTSVAAAIEQRVSLLRPSLEPALATAHLRLASAPDPPIDFSHIAPPPPPPLHPARVGFYALDLASAYRYVVIQWLDLWCHTFMWLDADGFIGICTDTRLCFGGAYGPNRFERITSMVGAIIDARIAAFDALHPYPDSFIRVWRPARRQLQARGLLPPGPQQLAPRSLQVFLDDFNGVGGLDTVPPPEGVKLLSFDADEMRQLGLRPAPRDSRLVAHASIAAHLICEVGFDVADSKTMVGSSIISLGLQPDAALDTISCPQSKRRILMGQCTTVRERIASSAGVDRVDTTRVTGRLCNISQLFPEIAAELNGGYTVGNARMRQRASQAPRRFLTVVPLTPLSAAGQGYDRLAAVALDLLEANVGVPLASSELFPPPGAAGVATVVGDASGDVAGGDAGFGGVTYLPDAPGIAFVTSVPWPPDLAEALAQSALQPHLRSGAPRLSMPAAELFTSWACLEAALGVSGYRDRIRAAIAVGDCQPAAAALNRASSPISLMREILHAARASLTQWLGVQVPRELNTLADVLSHPSRLPEALATIAAQGDTTPVLAPLPPDHPVWATIRAAIAVSDPADADF